MSAIIIALMLTITKITRAAIRQRANQYHFRTNFFLCIEWFKKRNNPMNNKLKKIPINGPKFAKTQEPHIDRAQRLNITIPIAASEKRAIMIKSYIISMFNFFIYL